MKKFRTKSFENQCVLLNTLLNLGELSYHCSFIGLNDVDFNSRCLFNAKYLFSEMLSPKNHGQVSFDQNNNQDAVLLSFTETLPNITTDTHTREQISSPLSSKRKYFATKLCSSFGVNYQKICDVVMKRQSLKSKDDC